MRIHREGMKELQELLNDAEVELCWPEQVLQVAMALLLGRQACRLLGPSGKRVIGTEGGSSKRGLCNHSTRDGARGKHHLIGL